MTKRKPKGYWKEWRNVKNELEKVVKKIGHFPSGRELSDLGFSSLGMAVHAHGGFSEARVKMGHEPSRVPDEYYNNFKVLQRALETIIEETGEFPNFGDLTRTGRNDIVGGLNKHGGINSVRERMGYESDIKPQKYWCDPKNILTEAKKVMKDKKLERIPNKEELAELGHSSLAAAITKTYPGKYTGLRRDLGETVDRKEHGYWDEPKNVEKEVRAVMKEHKLKIIPSSKFLKEIDRTDLGMAISMRYPGGYESTRQKFGETDIRKPAAYWSDIDNVKREAKKIIKEFGYLPGKRELCNKRHSSFAASVVKRHGGFRKFRKLLGEDQKRVSDGHWKDPRNIEREIKRFKLEQGYDYLPTQKELGELGYSSLSAAISSFYPGGIEGYRERNNDFTPNQTRRKTTGKTPEMLKLEKRFGEPIEDYLGRMYESHSSCELAKKLKVSEPTVLLWLRNFGIEVRNQSHARTFRAKKPTKEELNRLYWEEGKSKKELLEHLGIGHRVLDKWFNEYEIETREDKRVDLEELSRAELIAYGRENYKGITMTELHRNFSNDYKYLQSSGLIDLMVEQGFVLRSKSKNGFWSRDKVLEVATQLYKERGNLPTQQEFAKLGYGSLPGAAVEHFGGLRQLRSILEQGEEAKSRLATFLEGYAESQKD